MVLCLLANVSITKLAQLTNISNQPGVIIILSTQRPNQVNYFIRTMRILVDSNVNPLTRQEYEDILLDYFGTIDSCWDINTFEVLRNDKLMLSMMYHFDTGIIPAHIIVSDEGYLGISEDGSDVDFV